MSVSILSLALLCTLAWVVVVKLELADLRAENKKLRAALKLGIRDMPRDVELIKGSTRWGKKSRLAHDGSMR